MIKTIDDFYKSAEKYIVSFNSFSKKNELLGIVKSDHICYKCETSNSFENLRSIFESNSEYIYQSIISNRRIAYIRLKNKIETVLGEINFLELSDQKPDGSQKEGFDHIEVYPTGILYEEMIKKLEAVEKVKKVERPHHTTHDIAIERDFIFRCTQGPLINKIKADEMI